MACLDTKRQRIYFGGGYYPVAPGPSAFWCYDIKSNIWADLQPKGKPCGGNNRFGPNLAVLNYDSVNDAAILFYHINGSGGENDAKVGRGIYAYDPAANSWSDSPQPLPQDFRSLPNSFYSPEMNAHFIHIAGDSADDGVMWAYRYKRAADARGKQGTVGPAVRVRCCDRRPSGHMLQ